MNGQAQTWAQLRQRYGKQPFIGRQQEQKIFRLNFIYQLPEYLIFAIYGPTGVGKSTLLNRYRGIAQAHGATSVLVNAEQAATTHQQTILYAMTAISRQMAQANTLLTTFEERYRQYTETLQTMVEDHETPAGVFDLLSGIAKPAEAEAQAWDTYLHDKLMTSDQINLIKNPVQALTQAFVKDLGAWATIRHIVIAFDDWDIIGNQLGPWLRDWLAPGDISTNIWIALAGNRPLKAAWQPYASITASLTLTAFTADETRAYTLTHGVQKEEHLSPIWTYSKGNPLLVSLLTSAANIAPPTNGGLAVNGMERYLKWLADDTQREIVLRCAAPRTLDATLTEICTDDAKTDNASTFDFLTHTPLLTNHRGQYRYHPTLRDQVRALAQQHYPDSLPTAHTKLHAHYAAQLATFGNDPHYRDPQWRQSQLEYLYHGLMLNRSGAERDGLTLFLMSLRVYYPLAGEIVQTWAQAAAEQSAPNSVTDWAATLDAAWEALECQDWDALLTFCILVARRNDLSYEAQEELHAIRILLKARQQGSAPIETAPVELASSTETTPQPSLEQIPVNQPMAPDDNLMAISPAPPAPTIDATQDIIKQPLSANAESAIKEPPIKESPVAAADHIAKQVNLPTIVNFGTIETAATEPERPSEIDTQTASARVVPTTPDAVVPAIIPEPDHAAEPETPLESEARPDANIPGLPETESGNTAASIQPQEKADAAEPETTNDNQDIPPETSAAEVSAEVSADDYNNRGNVYLGMGEYQKAIRDYTQAIALNPDYVGAYYNRALAFTQLRGFDHAIEDYTHTLALNPNFAAAYKNRGVIHASCKEYARAIADYTEALRRKPDDATTYNNRGNAHYNLATYDQAITDYDQAIALNPNYARAYLNRGLAYTSTEEYQQAIADYNQAITLNPATATAYVYRGQAYARLEQHPQALADYDHALELTPNYPLVHNNRGLALVKLGRYAEGIEAYRSAIEHNPKYATAYYNAACAAALMNNPNKACTWLEKAITLHPQYQIMAQRDVDFKNVSGNLCFRKLLNP